MKALQIITAASCIALLAGNAQGQGNLTPPGAPSPTMKTLEQIEPRIDVATVAGNANYHHVISQAGSYYLSGNLLVTKTSGIWINAAGVTLDLNGFEISHNLGSGRVGVIIEPHMDYASIHNGTIVGFDYGVWCYPDPPSSDQARGCLFEKLVVTGCEVYGILAGASARIIDCRAVENQGRGIYAGTDSILSGCAAISNQTTTGSGISVKSGSTLSSCTAKGNQNVGIFAYDSSLIGCTAGYNQSHGISASGRLEGCIAKNNQGDGISAGIFTTLNGCTAYFNRGYGIITAWGSSLIGCTANMNRGTSGIYTTTGCKVKSCTAAANEGTGPLSYGIYAEGGSLIVDCTAFRNSNTNKISTSTQGVGIYAEAGSSIINCTVSENQGDGIWINGDCLARGNTCRDNGYDNASLGIIGSGAGIHATSFDNRIDGNTLTDNDRGINVDSNGSLIIRNSATGNSTDYDISGTHTVGPIISVSGTISSTSPWANFEY